MLDAINYTVSASIILLAAAGSLFGAFGYHVEGNIRVGIIDFFLTMALLLMSYGLWVLAKIAKLNNTQANAGTMFVHIVAYLLCILAQSSYYIEKNSVKALEATDIS